MLKRTLAALMAVGTLTSFSFQHKEHDCRTHALETFTTKAVKYQFLSPEDADYQPPFEQINDLKIDSRLRNFSGADLTKANEAMRLIKIVLNSREFQEAVLNFTFKGERRFHQNEGYSNEQIYDQLMEAREVLLPDSSGVVNLDLSLYTPKWWQFTQRNVIGYTNQDSMRIYSNTKYYRKFAASEYAGHVTHEWVHKMGYSHDFNDNDDRPYSVPYAVGYILRDLAGQLESGKKLQSLR